jgi:CheY-like chemotaxis protein
MPILVWLVDDGHRHHETAAATIAGLPAFELECFLTGSSAVAAYAERAAKGIAGLPRVVLMDFFLDGERGDEVTQELRAILRPGWSPIIIGYSSMRSGSERIVEAGGDLVLPKITGPHGTNPHLRTYLERLLDVARRSG